MIDAETELLKAVVDALRENLDVREQDCDVEYDDEAPAMSGDIYYAVIPAGVSAGQHHHAGGTIDCVVSCRVTVLKRAAHVPRDRRRDVFLRNLSGINAKLQEVADIVNSSYTIINAANLELSGCFQHPLQMTGFAPPRPFSADAYDGQVRTAGSQIMGVKRSVEFSGARYLNKVSG